MRQLLLMTMEMTMTITMVMTKSMTKMKTMMMVNFCFNQALVVGFDDLCFFYLF